MNEAHRSLVVHGPVWEPLHWKEVCILKYTEDAPPKWLQINQKSPTLVDNLCHKKCPPFSLYTVFIHMKTMIDDAVSFYALKTTQIYYSDFTSAFTNVIITVEKLKWKF